MTELLASFGSLFAATAAWAIPAAFAWGVLSVVLSPCHLAGIPLVVAYMSGEPEPPRTRRATALSTAFALGTLGSVAAVGGVTVAAGRMAGDVGRAGSFALAAVFFVFGLELLGVVRLPAWAIPSVRRLRGAPGALLLGLLFGAALGPCTFAFMAPLLGIAFSAGAEGELGVLLVAGYAIGHAIAIAVAGVSAQGVQRWITSRSGARAVALSRGLAGSAVILVGVYFLWTMH